MFPNNLQSNNHVGIKHQTPNNCPCLNARSKQSQTITLLENHTSSAKQLSMNACSNVRYTRSRHFKILKQTKSFSYRPSLQALYGCTSAAFFPFSSAALLLLDRTLSGLFGKMPPPERVSLPLSVLSGKVTQ